MPNTEEQEFICLECGSKRCGAMLQAGVSYSGDDPWSYVAGRDVCHDCKTVLPRALARRWNDKSFEAARAIWLDKFKATYPGRWQGA